MARKPAHLEMAGGRGPRQRIWEFIRKNAKDFAMLDIEKITIIDIATIRSYIQALEKGGFIVQTNETVKLTDRKQFKLVRDVGVEAPRVDRKGKVIGATGTENMWRTMRIMGDFTATELATRASSADNRVAELTAKSYVSALKAAGYLTIVDKGYPFVRGVGAKQNRYRIAAGKYTGPRPPMIQRTRCVYDPNLGKIVWQEEPDHDAA